MPGNFRAESNPVDVLVLERRLSSGGATSSILDVRLSHQLPQIFKLTTQADNDNSICFGDMIWG